MRHSIPQFMSARDVVWAQVLVAIALYCAGDLLIGGPLTELTLEHVLVRPVESRWGFHAEPIGRYPGVMAITRVTTGGAFARAGVEPGYAFWQYHCSGGPAAPPHDRLAGRQQLEISFMIPVPGDPWASKRIKVELPPP